jgi:spore germination protein KB
MREEGHIGPAQGSMLVYAVLMAKLFLQYPAFLIEVGGPAAWQVALVMTAGALLLFLPMGALARRFPGQGLAEIGEVVAGSFLGPLLTLLVAVWMLLVVSLTLRNFTETFIVTILPSTPPSVISIAAIICIAYASYRGLEPLTRTVQVLFPVILAGALILLLMSLPRGEISRFYPFWGHGIIRTLTGGLYYTGMGAEAIIVLIFGYCFRQGQMARTSGLLGILFFGLTTMLTVAILVITFGAPDAAQQPFPMFNLARLVYLGRFLQRTEALIIMFWFFAAAVRLSALFHAGVISITDALGLPYYRPVVFPVAMLTVSLSLVPKDFVTVMRLDRDWMRPLGVGIMLIPLLLLVLAIIRKKGGQAHAA